MITVGRRGGHAGNTERIVGCDDDWTVRVARTPEALREMWVVMGRGGGENAGNIDGKNVWAVMERRVARMRGINFVCVMIAEWATDENGENIIRIVT